MTNDSSDRRKGVEAIPPNLSDFLTAEQVKKLPTLEAKGISLFAIRRPLFQEPIVIVKFLSRGGYRGYGVLLENGDVIIYTSSCFEWVCQGLSSHRSRFFPRRWWRLLKI